MTMMMTGWDCLAMTVTRTLRILQGPKDDANGMGWISTSSEKDAAFCKKNRVSATEMAAGNGKTRKGSEK